MYKILKSRSKIDVPIKVDAERAAAQKVHVLGVEYYDGTFEAMEDIESNSKVHFTHTLVRVKDNVVLYAERRELVPVVCEVFFQPQSSNIKIEIVPEKYKDHLEVNAEVLALLSRLDDQASLHLASGVVGVVNIETVTHYAHAMCFS